MKTFLQPIEVPSSLTMKVAYFFIKRAFGKVITSVKVHAVRLPTAFGMFYAKVGQLDRKLKLPKELVLLLRQQVAQINTCNFCIDASRAEFIKASFDEMKFDHLIEYSLSEVFTKAEKSALLYVTELTKEKQVRLTTFEQLKDYFSEREICEIVYLVASEHLYNLTNAGLNIKSDMLCSIARDRVEIEK
ncbi:MAG: carboxymuconolactone decarboxylase family protein [Chryseolinea sp.]